MSEEIRRGVESYTKERWMSLNRLVEEYTNQATRFLFFSNSGGAVAVLSYLGVAKENSLSPNLKITLGLFVAGIILCGITIVLLFHRFSGLLDNWSSLTEKFYENELDYFEMLEKDKAKYSKTAWGWVTGYGSFIFFVFGVIIAIWPIIFSPSPVYADTFEGITSEQIAWNQILGISTVFIAVMAVFFTYWQIKILKKHNRLSVKPHLNIHYRSESDDTGQCFELENNGIGPAIIKTYKIFVSGTLYETKTNADVIKVYESLGIRQEFCNLNRLEKDDAQKAGYAKPLINIPEKYRNSEEANANFRNGIFKIGFEIKYESMYGEEFTLKRESFIPFNEMA